jgi:lysophospholipase L1-like esterase
MSFQFTNVSGVAQTQRVPGYADDRWQPGETRSIPDGLLNFFRTATGVFAEAGGLTPAQSTSLAVPGLVSGSTATASANTAAISAAQTTVAADTGGAVSINQYGSIYVASAPTPPNGSALVVGDFCRLKLTTGKTVASSRALLKNFSPLAYPNLRKAMALQRGGTSFTALCIGDSTTMGGYGGANANAVSQSWVRRLADQLTAQGIKAGWQNVMGEHRADQQGSTVQTVDTRVSAFSAGWALVTGLGLSSGIGGYGFYNNTNTNPFTFAPTVQTDTLDLFYFDVAGYDSIIIKSGASGTTAASTGGTVAMTSASKLKKATATYTLGSNVWTAQKANANGANLILQGMSAYNSALPEISLLNCGCASQSISYFTATTNFWDTLSQVTAGSGLISPLAIINVGINDWIAASSRATFRTSLATLVSGLQGSGTDVLLVVPVPSALGNASDAAQVAIQDAIYDVAAAYGCAVVDMHERWQDCATSSPLGLYGDGIIHPSITSGYADLAAAIKQLFLSF